MAGHSKWSKIKRAKGAADVKRGAVLAKMGKAILVAARTGGSADPKYNFKLRATIEKAKAEGVPNDNIKRALEKAAGGGDGAELKEVSYEGYLPGGVAVMVEAATDNINRTYNNVRTIFNKSNGSLGNPGCVAYMFQKRGEIHINKPENWNEKLEEELLELAMEAGADDMDASDNDEIIIITAAETIEEVSAAFEDLLTSKSLAETYQVSETKDLLVPENTVSVTNTDEIKDIMKAMDAFEDDDDVIDTIANFDIDESLI